MPGWARFLEISRLPRSATNVNDYRGSVGVVGYSCLPPRRRPRVAVSAMPQCDDLDTPGHPCVRITKDLDAPAAGTDFDFGVVSLKLEAHDTPRGTPVNIDVRVWT